MRICVVNSFVMARAFESLGHEVLALAPGPDPIDLPALLDGRGFVPELLLEVELLGPRTVLTGLGGLSCAKLFWSVDTHLNAWWHRAYGRMFDAVLTTQDAWVPRLRLLGLPVAEPLPWFGVARPFRPWSGRSMDLCFVGRVTPARPLRARLVEFLKDRHGLFHADGLGWDEMLALYDDARLVPNEAVFSEINFRLFEAASCGCLVLNQSVASDISRVFEPGREVVVFEDVLELDSHIRRLRADPRSAEAMARAAWARVNAEHLPEHRAARILDLARRYAGRAPQGPKADSFAWESVFRMAEAGVWQGPLDRALAAMAERQDAPDGVAALLRALHFCAREGEALALLVGILATKRFEDAFEVNFTGSVLAWRCGRTDLARAFWLRHARGAGARPMAETAVGFWMGWAAQCARFWLPVRSGFLYVPGRGLPDSAMDCLMEVNELDPGNLDAARSMNVLLAEEGSGGDGIRLQVLSHLSLHAPGDWRLGLELGLVNLRAMRMREGLEELDLALRTAREAGREDRFMRLLAASDRTGLIAAALSGA